MTRPSNEQLRKERDEARESCESLKTDLEAINEQLMAANLELAGLRGVAKELESEQQRVKDVEDDNEALTAEIYRLQQRRDNAYEVLQDLLVDRIDQAE